MYLVALLAVFLTTACAGRMAPDLKRLYYSPYGRDVPVIVVPGIFGSRLLDAQSGDEVWPASVWTVVRGKNFDRLAMPVGDLRFGNDAPQLLMAKGLFAKALRQDFYGQIVATLEDVGGYTCVDAEEVLRAKADCYLFAWDWRDSFAEAARHLHQLILAVRERHGDPNLRVDIVAHSAGGLVTRYYLRYGALDLEAAAAVTTVPLIGATYVRQAVLIGTPNFGATVALQESIKGHAFGFAEITPEIFATMPSMGQLLPHPDQAWMLTVQGDRLRDDLFSVATWRKYRWGPYDPKVMARMIKLNPDHSPEEVTQALQDHFSNILASGRVFHEVLSRPIPPSPAAIIVFGSGCIETPARCVLEPVDGEIKMRLRPRDIKHPVAGVDYHALMVEPGDGSVTKASLLARNSLYAADDIQGFFPIDYSVFICERHDQLPGNITFRDNLMHVLTYGVRRR